MIYRLFILSGDRRGQQVTVPADSMTIGRGEDCALRLNDPEAAVSHAVVERTPRGLLIRDLGSIGKILVNNREVPEAQLRHGDVVEIGQTRFLVQAVVEAEVHEAEAVAERRRVRLKAAAVIAVAALAVLAFWGFRGGEAPPLESPAPQAPPPPAPETSTVPVTAVATAETTEAVAPLPPAPTQEVTAAGDDFWRDTLAVDPMVPPEPTNAASEPAGLPSPAATAQTEQATAPAAEPDELFMALVDAKVQDMMMQARLLTESNRLAEADQMFAGVQAIVPDYPTAYAERARLFEERHMLDPAIAQWEEAIGRDGGSKLSRTAEAERRRLLRARQEVTPGFSGQVKVAAVDQTRFPQTAEVREMRSVAVALAPGQPLHGMEAEAVRVDVIFFDRDAASGEVRPTRAVGSGTGLTVPAPWPAGERKTVTATYMAAANAGGRDAEQYCGYVVRVYYYGALQDEQAWPTSLLRAGAAAAARAATPPDAPPPAAATNGAAR